MTRLEYLKELNLDAYNKVLNSLASCGSLCPGHYIHGEVMLMFDYVNFDGYPDKHCFIDLDDPKKSCEVCWNKPCIISIDESRLKNVPTADVANVVRCRDCKYNVANQEPDPCDATDYTDIVCTYHMSDGFDPEDFCSKGIKTERNKP